MLDSDFWMFFKSLLSLRKCPLQLCLHSEQLTAPQGREGSGTGTGKKSTVGTPGNQRFSCFVPLHMG